MLWAGVMAQFLPPGRDGHTRTVHDSVRSPPATDVHDQSISAADTFDQLRWALLWFDVHGCRCVNASVAAQQTAYPAQGLWAHPAADPRRIGGPAPPQK